MTSPKQQYIERQMKDCREHWFKDHKATVLVGPPLEQVPVFIINWQKPDSWNYGCRFIIHRRWLCVVGDIGEATFEWSQDIDLALLGGIDFGYFLSKCQASPKGRAFEDWDSQVAWQTASEHIKDLEFTPPDEASESIKGELEALSGLGNDSLREDYQAAAQEIYDLTGDAEGASTISGFGIVPSCHAIGMFIGLQMAIAQLKGGAS